MRVDIVLFIGGLTLFSCAESGRQDVAKVKAEIQAQLDKCVLAVSTKNIDLYMELMPADFIIRDESGEIITREKQREYTLRDWSIIDTTLSNRFVVDSLTVAGDSASVYTSQRWERLMFRRDGKTLDTVLTTQRHREVWRKRPQGWLNYDVTELGGEVYINGNLYKPD